MGVGSSRHMLDGCRGWSAYPRDGCREVVDKWPMKGWVTARSVNDKHMVVVSVVSQGRSGSENRQCNQSEQRFCFLASIINKITDCSY